MGLRGVAQWYRLIIVGIETIELPIKPQTYGQV